MEAAKGGGRTCVSGLQLSDLWVLLQPADAARAEAGSVRCPSAAHIVPPLKAEAPHRHTAIDEIFKEESYGVEEGADLGRVLHVQFGRLQAWRC